jgi:hypothetical protein
MYKIILPALLIFIGLSAGAQNKAVIKGKITDSLNHAPLELATVAVLDTRDTTSTLLSYTLSDKTGAFTLHNLPVDIPLKVLISFVAYKPYRKNFTLKKGESLDLGTISLSFRQLNEVVIKGERMPIVIRKDTIEFDAEAFKTRPNAVVEDLLKKLPGVEVANDGTITVMGKDVTKILVDGREFFANDPRIATKNLDADMIAKVQVYDDRENDPHHILPEARLKKIINLKFKKILKKSIFGKVYAGGGTRDHYQAGGLLNMFRDTLQVSLLGLSNNLNSTGFGFNDLYNMGGLNRGGGAFSQGGLFFGAAPQGKQTLTSGGVNINTDYGKKLKINLSYLYSRTHNDLSSITRTQQFLGDTTAVTQSESDNSNTFEKHIISGTVQWRPNDTTTLRYNPAVNIQQGSDVSTNTGNSFSNFVNPINNTTGNNHSASNSFQFQHTLNYDQQLKKGASINIIHSLQISPSSSINYDNQDLTSYVSSFPSYILRRRGNNNSRNNNASITASYRYPITKKLTFDISTGVAYNDELDKVSTYNYNPVTGSYDSLLLVQSSDLTRKLWMQTVNPGVSYHFPKDITLTAHLSAMFQQVNNIFNRDSPNINQHFENLLPSIEINRNGLSLSYNKNVQIPNIGDMIPYTVVFSPLSSVTGNPNLKPTTTNGFNLNYSRYNYQSGVNFFAGVNANFEQNAVFRERTINQQLVETSTPINRDGRYNYSFNGSVGKRFKKQKDLSLNAHLNLRADKSHDFYVLNYKDGYQDNYNANISAQVSVNWKDIIELDPQYTITGTHTTYSGINFNSQNYIMHNAQAHFNLFWPKHMNLEGNYNYLYNPRVPQGFQKNSNLLSLSLARQFLKKDKGEIKLSCYDIFNQNISTTRYVNQNTITDTQSQIVKRYFMLTLQFKFNKSTVKGEDKTAASPLILR